MSGLHSFSRFSQSADVVIFDLQDQILTSNLRLNGMKGKKHADSAKEAIAMRNKISHFFSKFNSPLAQVSESKT